MSMLSFEPATRTFGAWASIATVGVGREQRALVLQERQRHVRGEALLRVRDHEARARLRAGEREHVARVHALESRVEARPARDAVDVLHVLGARQLVELLPREL